MTGDELLAGLSVGGKPSKPVLRVKVEEAFLSCGRALFRSRLWDPEARIDRSSFPSYGQVLAGQLSGADAGQIDAA